MQNHIPMVPNWPKNGEDSLQETHSALFQICTWHNTLTEPLIHWGYCSCTVTFQKKDEKQTLLNHYTVHVPATEIPLSLSLSKVGKQLCSNFQMNIRIFNGNFTFQKKLHIDGLRIEAFSRKVFWSWWIRLYAWLTLYAPDVEYFQINLSLLPWDLGIGIWSISLALGGG